MSFIALMRPNEVMVELGSRLQQHRLKQNISQAALARRLGVSIPTISNLENGKNTTLETFIGVVFALGLQNELQELFNQPTLTIAELERLSAEPKRQRARPSQPKYPLKTSQSKPNAMTGPTSSRTKLWDKSLFNPNKESND
ncbi:MAG: helix-turn-helix transcriptional regulator [Alcaligenaceae bacterium]|jgi:transcriptional regulator with XRE-family HTH domain|nr:helix-turn-helix transcriptional regulator [Alcaligenaceae bacterium]